ncbi:hypothetical protein QLF84_24160, partial [Salmonella enterica subsp. enterica serovar Oslo]|nr:hypothetical protein [Salmonella enterica subsp. enterica serovar Oslo]
SRGLGDVYKRQVITLKPIIETQGTSFILLLHPVEQMRQLMTSQLGKVSHTFAHMPQDDPQTRRLIHFGRQAARSSFPVLLCGDCLLYTSDAADE